MKVGKFIVGLGIGTALGLLFAPKKGSELREELQEKGKKAYDDAKNMTKEDVQEIVSDSIDSVKKTIDEFDLDEFTASTAKKLEEAKDKLEEVAKSIQETDEYGQVVDVVKKVSNEVTDKVDEIRTKVKNNDFAGMDEIEEEIDAIDDELEVIIDDLKN